MSIVGISFLLLTAITEQDVVKAQMGELPPVPPAEDIKCVSGFCLPRGYKKLETPTDGRHLLLIIEISINLGHSLMGLALN